MKIAFLLHGAYGIGGTVRTVMNLASALAERHEVEIASVYRRFEEPMLDTDPRVRLVPLVDMRPVPDGVDQGHPLHRERSALVPPSEEFFREYSALSDERIVEYLRNTDADVVIGTRPALNLLVAQYAPERSVRLAQEHMSHLAVHAETRDEMRRTYHRIDASVTVTEADAETFRRTTAIPGLRLLCIPNSVPEPDIAPADASSRTVIAAGRLDPVKRYDVLVHAFARVLAEAPDWKLRIYGRGVETARLQQLIQELGLYEDVLLMGPASPLEAEWVKGSIAAVTSERESFGMTLVEAMRCGLPVVSTDCPDGPPEIIRDGEDGFLVPTGSVEAVAEALLKLVRDEELRAAMGKAAVENARRYDPDAIARRYEALIEEIRLERGPAPRTESAAPRSVLLAAAQAYTGPGGHESVRRTGGLRALAGRVVRGGRRADQQASGGSTRSAGVGAPMGRAAADADGRCEILVDWPGFLDPEAKLVCRARSDRRQKHVMPLLPAAGCPAGPGGRLAARLPQAPTGLAEGRWDLYVETGGRLHRLRAGVRDLRRLVDPEQRTLSLPLQVDVPYPTLDGFLAVRSWCRPRHAEATSVRVEEEGIVLAGRLVAERFGDEVPVLTVRRRQLPPAEYLVEGTTDGGSGFRFLLPVEELVRQRIRVHEDWDFFVGIGGGEPVRLERILSDQADLRTVQVYPTLVWHEEEQEDAYVTPAVPVRVHPYCTTDNAIAMNVVEKSG